MIILKDMKDKHILYMKDDDSSDLCKNLAHVYHFYLHGVRGRHKKLEFDGLSEKGVVSAPFVVVFDPVIIKNIRDLILDMCFEWSLNQ